MFFKNSVLRCYFAVFCGVLRCFVCVFVAFFTKQQKTDQKVYKTHKTNNKQITLCAVPVPIQLNTVLCIFLSLRKCLQIQKKSQNTSKTLENIRKTPQNTVKKNTRKTPQNTRKNTRKTPQNTAKHDHKTHLLTKQTKLANKPLRSHFRRTQNFYGLSTFFGVVYCIILSILFNILVAPCV